MTKNNWEESFDEFYEAVTLDPDLLINFYAQFKSFVRNELEKAHEEGRQEIISEMSMVKLGNYVRIAEQARIIGVLGGLKKIDNIDDALFSSMNLAWNEALETAKEKIKSEVSL